MNYTFYTREDVGISTIEVSDIATSIPEEVRNVLDKTRFADGTQFDITNTDHWHRLPEVYPNGSSRLWVISNPTTYKVKAKFKGGPGSGFEGHAGRPGQVGGSQSSYIRPREFAKVVRKKFKDAIITSRGYEGLALGGNIAVHFYEDKYPSIINELKTFAEENGYVVGYTNLQDVSTTGVNSVGVTLDLKGLHKAQHI